MHDEREPDAAGTRNDRSGDAAVRVRACRSCGSSALRSFLSLGATPIANALVDPLTAGDGDAGYPLEVGFCTSCALVQLVYELPAELIFGAEYPYFSSFSDMLVRHAAASVDALVVERGLGADSFVVELASNDGYLLQRFVEHGVPVLGIEPTPGPAEAARQIGVPTTEAFFDAELGARIRSERGPADVIIANNVMAHVPDLNSFVAGMAALVADDGIVSVENPGVRYLLEHVEFDTIYHEHFCYFSTLSVKRLFERHGLHLQDVRLFEDLHGGTLRWTGGKQPHASAAVEEHLGGDLALGLDCLTAYEDFGARVKTNQDELRELLGGLRSQGATIAAYGATAKGATLLNTTGIGADVIDFVVDRNPHKQGKLMPGVRLPILDPAALVERRPDYVLLLAWNLRDEVMAQQEDFRRGGGRFIVPVPRPEVV